MNQFKPEELVHRNDQVFPKVSGRLRLFHEGNEKLSISTELIHFNHMANATVRATVTTGKGNFTGYGCSSSEKDQDFITSLLEVAETRAIARALRFAGYGLEFTGSEEISYEPQNFSKDNGRNQSSEKQGQNQRKWSRSNSSSSSKSDPITQPQKHAIETIARVNKWNPLQCCRRILAWDALKSLGELSKHEAGIVISKMKDQLGQAA